MTTGWLEVLSTSLVMLGISPMGLQRPPEQIHQLPQETIIAAELDKVVEFEGDRLRVNDQVLRGHWAVWSDEGELRLGIDSPSLENNLGVQLLDSQSVDEQPIDWFGTGDRLPIQFANPYRYLDVTELARQADWQWQQQGDVLVITTPPASIQGIRLGKQDWGRRLVLDLDRPTVWRKAAPHKIELQAVVRDAVDLKNKQDIDAEIETLFSLAQSGKNTTILTFPEAIAPQLRVLSLNNPPRLVIDVNPETEVSRNVAWLPGVTWQQQTIVLPNQTEGFAVTWLDIAPSQQSFELKPMLPSNNTVIGLSPMVTQTSLNGAIAGINGGFFNRNNQLPLGAMRQDQEWLSGPILNRGAVAWDNKGNWEFDRLSLQEEIVAANGERLTVDFLNSGYVKAGVARYTKAWGDRYQTLVDNEVILEVDTSNNSETVTHRKLAGRAGIDAYTIPETGYLLVFRSFQSGADKLPEGITFARTAVMNPPSFDAMPQVMGAGPLLLQQGRLVLDGELEQFSQAFNIQSASRSAIARTRDNRILLATVHGSAAETSGATLQEWAEILQRLGAVDALNLDGGGSSALVLGGEVGDRHGSTVGRVNNGIGLFLNP